MKIYLPKIIFAIFVNKKVPNFKIYLKTKNNSGAVFNVSLMFVWSAYKKEKF